MNPQKNQVADAPSLLDEIRTETSAESAPLLRFIVRHAGVTAGLVVCFLLLVVGMGIWQWRSGAKSAEVADELARIAMTGQGEGRVAALAALALSAPDKSKLAVYMTLGRSAVESGDYAAAAAAYADAARQGGDGPFGTAAMIAQACALLRGGKSADAVIVLREAEKRLPEEARTPQLRQMLAEAAVSAGQEDLAAVIYENLASAASRREGDYFRARAAALARKEAGGS
ncbi:MAG: tetratricopeptide repeat protein [Desulfovibrio sp.]|jgi:cytochrome c-type biogenesis protein CcmH/NrfG|nr:tetratricopeptide repeat protein [Desulfovibrio sp.]